MKLQELAGKYQAISEKLKAKRANPGDLLDMLSADYRYVAWLLVNYKHNGFNLVRSLRRNLYRSHGYAYSKRRNATLQIMANTIERGTVSEVEHITKLE